MLTSATLLARQCLQMHRLVQINAYHLGNASRIIAVGLVKLSLEKSLCMSGGYAANRR